MQHIALTQRHKSLSTSQTALAGGGLVIWQEPLATRLCLEKGAQLDMLLY